MFTPKIIALDLDGTLFSRDGEVTPFTKEQIRLAKAAGIAVVISSGRPFSGLPFDVAKELGISYAITANGAGVYRMINDACMKMGLKQSLPQNSAGICVNGICIWMRLSMGTLTRRMLHLTLSAIPFYRNP